MRESPLVQPHRPTRLWRALARGALAASALCTGLGPVSGATVTLAPEGPVAAAWPRLARPAADSPSVLLVMTDDVGFGASSTFGGPIDTPTLDALAKGGLRYDNMTTTGICSPTRAALLTGRNHNAVNVGNVMDGASGLDGFTSVIPKSAATGARLLEDAGYSTAMFGKGHITPLWETGPGGPFDRWPTGLGFQYFYGFLGGDTNQWAPALYENTTPVDPPANDPRYILDHDLADKAIAWLDRQQGANPGKPFFVYYAPGTSHAPHHAPADWIARFEGRFDQGWDAVREQTLARQKALGLVPPDTRLAARPAQVPAWDGLSAQQKRVYAHEMAVYAAALAYADHEIGRVVDEARRQARGNLMVVFVEGDNGASAEAGLDGTLNEHALFSGVTDDLATLDARRGDMGGPRALNHYSSGWALAMDTPFPYFKQLSSHYGATRNGVVIEWRGHIRDAGGIRAQFHHVTDLMPTILEAAHVTPPGSVDGVEQQPFDGMSMSYSFDDAAAPSRRRTQYYAIWDNMAIYHDGWVAASVPEVMPWVFGKDAAVPAHVDGRRWRLFDVAHDFSESTDLAAGHPDKLRSLQELFFAEAGRNDALPIHRYEGTGARPDYNAGQAEFHFLGPVSRIPEDVAPPIVGRGFVLDAKVLVKPGATDGVLMAVGGRFGGMSLYVRDGRPIFEYNFEGHGRSRIAAADALAPGEHVIALQFDRRKSPAVLDATATLRVDGKPAGSVHIDRTIGYRFSLDESFDIGRDTGTPVSDDYATPDVFAGEIRDVSIHVD